MCRNDDPGRNSQMYVFPAVPLQERIWRLNAHGEADPAWNVAVRFQLSGDLSLVRLQEAVDAVVARTEILRTGFALIEDSIKQLVVASLFVPICLVDCSASSNFEQELVALSRQEAELPIDMQQAPLLRVTIVRHHATRHYLLVTAHHGIMDGYSVGLFSDALLAAYSDPVAARHAAIDEPLQFADYAIWLEERRQSAEYHALASYWLRTLEGAPSIEPGPAAGASPIESLVLPRSLTDAAQQLSQRMNITFSEMALAVFACAANKLDDVIGVPVAARSELQLESMVGPLVNYLPIRIRAASDGSFEEVLGVVAELSREALAHSEFRYEDILEAKGLADNPLFSTVFICQRDFVQPSNTDGLELTAIPSLSPGALHALTVFLVERSDGWRLSCETDGRYVPDFARALLLQYQAVLQAVCDHPKIPVASLLAQASQAALEVGRAAAPSASARSLFRASATQERYWALNRIDPSSSRLNLHIRYVIDGMLDLATFRRALDMLAARHDALRTFFAEEDGRVWQHVSPALELPLCCYDLESAEPGAITHVLDEEERHHFDLERGPLWSVVLISCGQRSFFSLTLSHIISDGWSCGVLMRELLEAYEAIVAGRAPTFALLPGSFGEMADREISAQQSDNFSARLAYWDEVLAPPLPRLQLPDDGVDRSPVPTVVATRAIDPMLSATVIQIAREYSVTVATVYAAAYRALLFKHTGVFDLLIASPTANRAPGTEGLVGPFADSLLLRSSTSATFEDALEATQHALLSAVEHAVPLQYLMERLHHHDVAGGSAITLGFMYQEAFVHDMAGEQLTLRATVSPVAESSFDWHLAVIDRRGDLSLEFTATETTMSQELADAILEDFELSLSGFIAAPRKQLVRVAGVTARIRQMCSAAMAAGRQPAPAAQPPVRAVSPGFSSEKTAKMVRVWQHIFGRPQMTAQDNFFALGGHSLLLARLQVAIEKEFGYRIFAADIFAAPNCELLAERVMTALKSKSPARTRIIPVQPEGKETPLFVISQSLIIRELAERLRPHQPTFTIQFTEEDVDDLGAAASMQQVAARYIEHLRSARPVGPYRLGGWCVSGWVAYEMAQQLRAAGEDVELLLILDAWAPNFWRDMRGITRLLGKASYYAHRAYFEVVQSLTPAQAGSGILARSNSLRQTLQQRLAAIAGRFTRRRQTSVSDDTAFDQMMDFAIVSYRPATYTDDRALVFRSAEQPRGGTLPDDMGWYRYFNPAVRIVSLPGNHTGMFSGAGADIMAECIFRKVTARQRTTRENTMSSKKPASDLLKVPSCP